MEVSSYSTPATATVTSPYVRIPAIEKIRQFLCSHPVGTYIQTSVRQLARDADLKTAGQISYYLQQLAADGWIHHEAYARTTHITIERSIQPDVISPMIESVRPSVPGEPSISAMIDDQSMRSPTAPPQPTPASGGNGAVVPPTRPPATGNEQPPKQLGSICTMSIMVHDRSAAYGTKHDSCQEGEEPRTHAQNETAQDPRFARLVEIGVDAPIADDLCRRRPDLTVAAINADLAVAGRRRLGIGFLVTTWRNGRLLAAPKPVAASHATAPPRPVSPSVRERSPERPALKTFNPALFGMTGGAHGTA